MHGRPRYRLCNWIQHDRRPSTMANQHHKQRCQRKPILHLANSQWGLYFLQTRNNAILRLQHHNWSTSLGSNNTLHKRLGYVHFEHSWSRRISNQQQHTAICTQRLMTVKSTPMTCLLEQTYGTSMMETQALKKHTDTTHWALARTQSQTTQYMQRQASTAQDHHSHKAQKCMLSTQQTDLSYGLFSDGTRCPQ